MLWESKWRTPHFIHTVGLTTLVSYDSKMCLAWMCGCGEGVWRRGCISRVDMGSSCIWFPTSCLPLPPHESAPTSLFPIKLISHSSWLISLPLTTVHYHQKINNCQQQGFPHLTSLGIKRSPFGLLRGYGHSCGMWDVYLSFNYVTQWEVTSENWISYPWAIVLGEFTALS